MKPSEANANTGDVRVVELRISKEYRASDGKVAVEHSALREVPAKWTLTVKCRDTQQSSTKWTDLYQRFPNAEVVETKTDLIVNLHQSPCPNNLVLAAFGTPGKGSKKRMQLITFAKHWPKKGMVEVFVFLIDDTQNAFEGICARQEAQGKNMLAPMAVLFVSPEEQTDIKIKVKDIQPGWKVDGKEEAIFAFDETMRSAELDLNSIPSHRFVFENTNTSEPYLSCSIVATHTRDEAVVEVLKSFKTRKTLVSYTTADNSPGRSLNPAGKQTSRAPELGSAVFTAMVFLLCSLWLLPVKSPVEVRDCYSQKMTE